MGGVALVVRAGTAAMTREEMLVGKEEAALEALVEAGRVGCRTGTRSEKKRQSQWASVVDIPSYSSRHMTYML